MTFLEVAFLTCALFVICLPFAILGAVIDWLLEVNRRRHT